MGAALSHTLVRQVTVAGFVADADPRATPPAATLMFAPKDRVSRQSADDAVKGVSAFIQFVDDSGNIITTPTVDFTVWFFDEGSKSWVQGPAAEGVQSNQLRTIAVVGKLFVQLNAIHAATGATKINTYVSELAIRPLGGALI